MRLISQEIFPMKSYTFVLNQLVNKCIDTNWDNRIYKGSPLKADTTQCIDSRA